MNADNQNLQQHFASLKQRFIVLGDRLAEAAQDLKDAGTPVSLSLVEELATYRRDFEQLRARIVDVGQTLPIPTSIEIISLKDLESLLNKITAITEKKFAVDEALKILDRVLILSHREQVNFPPLINCQEKARKLRDVITKSGAKVVAGVQLFADLLTLIEQRDSLNDEQWTRIDGEVSDVFGKNLAVAASRGKLIISQSATTAVTTAVTTAATTSSKSDVFIFGQTSPTNANQEIIILPNYESTPQKPAVSNLSFGAASPVNVTPENGNIGLKVLVHIQGIGDREFKENEYAGTRSQSRRIEGFQININPPIPGLSVRYMAHIEGIGDTAWIEEGKLLGGRGQGRRMEGFAIELTGTEASKYNIFYTAHIQNIGDSSVCSNGQYCGTRRQALRIEGIKIWIQRK